MMTGTDKIPGVISDFKEHHTETTIAFTVTATKEKIDEFENEKGGLISKFKLSTTVSTNNMTLFDVDGKIHKYETSVDILRSFFNHRLEFYVKRKDTLLDKLRKELKILENKERFIEEVCEGELVVSNRKRTELLVELSERGYDLCPKDEKMASDEDDEENSEDVLIEESASNAELANGYEYLLGLKIWTLTCERAEDISRQKSEKEREIADLDNTKPEAIWLADLDELDKALVERNKTLHLELKKAIPSQPQTTSNKRVVKQATSVDGKRKKLDEWDSDLASDSDDEAVSDSDADASEEDDFFREIGSPKKKLKTSSNPKQRVVLATRAQRKSVIVRRRRKSEQEAFQADSESDEKSPTKIPTKKRAMRNTLSIKGKRVFQTETEIIESDDDESPKKIVFKEDFDFDSDIDKSLKKNLARKKKSQKADSDSDKSPRKPVKATKRTTKQILPLKSVCLLELTNDESEDYGSDECSRREPAPTHGRKRLSNQKKYVFEESDDDFEF